jgi:hypothetical protein
LKITAAAGLVVGGSGDQRSRRRGFLSAAAKDHVDVDLDNVFVGNVELDKKFARSLM